jgi:protein SCO1
MRTHSRLVPTLASALAVAALYLSAPGTVAAQIPTPDPIQNIGVNPALLRDVGLDQNLNHQIPLDLAFRDEHGQTVQLRQFFGRRPVILTLVYYQCPMLCTEVLNGLVRTMRQMPLELRKDFSVVTLSIDPKEGPELASIKHKVYTDLYNRPNDSDGWHFLTGNQPDIRRLADAVGFRYAYDPKSGQYAHASGIMLLTPEGKLSRYFYGIEYPERDLRLALVEASQEKIGTPVDRILLYCFHYDPSTGKYGLLISRVIAVSGALTVLGLTVLIAGLFRHEKQWYGRHA